MQFFKSQPDRQPRSVLRRASWNRVASLAVIIVAVQAAILALWPGLSLPSFDAVVWVPDAATFFVLLSGFCLLLAARRT